MKERILTKWTFKRALYILLGIVVIVQSVMSKQWFGVAFGGYFASMGLFAFGCGAGNCTIEKKQKSNTTIQNGEFDGINSK
jgi:hypothetical protein